MSGIVPDLLVATILISVCVVIHATLLDRIMVLIQPHITKARGESRQRHLWKVMLGVVTVLGIFISHGIQIWLWAFVYLTLDLSVLQTLESAIYYSITTYTTLGYGDITLDPGWRVLGGLESANGIILIGWSTAFVFEIMAMLYPRAK